MLDLCREEGLTLATAESCTGGMVAERLTSVPGSSRAFVGAVVAYADEVKARELGVPPEILARHGAVSAEAAAAMAAGAREQLGADVAVAVTGIAGPGGGSEKKPVGTVIFARARRGADPKEIVADTKHFGDLGRGGVRLEAALCALELLMPVEKGEEA